MNTERENNIEFYYNSNRATASFTQGRYISRVKELAKRYPEECDIVQNSDGSVLAHFPTNWIKLNPPIELSDDQKKERADRLKKIREQRSI